MTTEAYRTPDGRIAVPVQHRRDMWLMIDHDGSTGVAVGALTDAAQPLTVATPFQPGRQTAAAATEVARLFRAYRHDTDHVDSARERAALVLFQSWPTLYHALDRLQREWQL